MFLKNKGLSILPLKIHILNLNMFYLLIQFGCGLITLHPHFLMVPVSYLKNQYWETSFGLFVKFIIY